jgi:hypothetical protein
VFQRSWWNPAAVGGVRAGGVNTGWPNRGCAERDPDPLSPSRPPQARQKWHITDDKDFQATPNTRNEMMMIEAQEFAAHLRRCEKDIRKTQASTEGAFGTFARWRGVDA